MVKPPVVVHAAPLAAAELLAELLGDDYGAVVEPGTDRQGDETQSVVIVEPIDEHRRGVVIYRIIQASRNVADQFPEASLYLVTEEGSRWRLPPPAI